MRSGRCWRSRSSAPRNGRRLLIDSPSSPRSSPAAGRGGCGSWGKGALLRNRSGCPERPIMENLNFVDYYEILELSAKANAATVERVFRHLATRYHPDNPETGNRALFELIIEAHNVLRDPEKRAAYDVRCKA